MHVPRRSRAALAILAVVGGLGSMLVIFPAAASVGSSPAGRAVAECRGGDLVGFSLGGGAAAGNESNLVGLVNRGTSSCRLGGYPGLEGTRRGHAYPLVVVGHGTFFGDLRPTILAPRVVGALILGTEDGCPAINQPNQAAQRAEIAAHSYTGLIIELPRHDGFVHVSDVHFDTACTLQSSRLGWAGWLLVK